MPNFDLQSILIRVPVFFFAITVHEAAHAWMAWKKGDPTAKDAGRLTLNPIVHLDPIGTLCIIFAPFGWAKPVPVNPYNLKDPRKDGYWIAAAGPLSNILLATITSAIFGTLYFSGLLESLLRTDYGVMVFQFLITSLVINLALAIFNTIPLFPLDGEKMLMGVVPWHIAEKMEAFRQFGPIVLLLLLISGVLGLVIGAVLLPALRLLTFGVY